MGKPARFRQADVERVIAAAQKTNLRDWSIHVDNRGTIILLTGTAAKCPSPSNSCDDLLE